MTHTAFGFSLDFLLKEMANETKKWLILSFLFLVTSCMQYCVHGESHVPCSFAFGDSFTDVGNNNNLPTRSKSNYFPYGIDFPQGPTGRYTNDQTSFDILTVKYLEFANRLPPYYNINGSDIQKGVVYASGGCGILDTTGYRTYGFCINFRTQVLNHKSIVSRIVFEMGSRDKAAEYLNKCLYYTYIGSNDYVNNYFLNNSATSLLYNPMQYAKLLKARYYEQLKELHGVGARLFAILGLFPLGCSVDYISNGSCNETVNAAVANFNAEVKDLVDQCNNNMTLPGAKCIYVNLSAFFPTPTNPSGFKNITGPCCQVDPVLGFCIRNSTPCPNRTEYVYYDTIHPTNRTNEIIAMNAYNSSNPNYTYPTDIKGLIQKA
ncbi:hypothetical protein VNO77_34087 [Canavalia gladiata]|uniref:Uncharacterized protein n=1 Tax=Canavalia gladiata TaxID=3824 RepID=A0AAN9KFM1_CANGL